MSSAVLRLKSELGESIEIALLLTVICAQEMEMRSFKILERASKKNTKYVWRYLLYYLILAIY